MLADENVKIPCISNYRQLLKICQEAKVSLTEEAKYVFLTSFLEKLRAPHFKSFISEAAAEGLINWKEDYEVEEIVDDCTDDEGAKFFLIKWKDWDSKFNTWEPETNLHCPELVKAYNRQPKINPRKRKLETTSKPIVQNTKSDGIFAKVAESVQNLDGLIKKISSYTEKNKRTFKLRHRKAKKVSRAEVEQALKKWETEINAIAKGYDRARLFVENKVDLEGPPENFVYLNERTGGKGVVLPTDPLIGCECEDCYADRKKCCPATSDSRLAYYKRNGRLCVPPGEPIFECNKRCKCGPDCCNRVVQKGRRFKLCIFRTANCRGWGVKTLQKIKKGSFVLEYVGEVITNEEAEKRGKYYDAVGHTYLFDLDFHDSFAPYTVDAGKYGNAAHFINHSCDPNLAVHVVWINTLDPQLPHICLFAKRDIQINEELTFDYMSGKVSGALHASLTSVSTDSEITLQPTIDGDATPPSTDIKLSTIDSDVPLPPSDSESKGNEIPLPSGDSDVTLTSKDSEVPLTSKDSEVPLTSKDSEVVLPDRDGDLTPPPTDTESNSSIEVSEIAAKLSMSCLCGSKNCRKILFF